MSGLLAILITAVMIPLLLAEATDWCRWLSFKVVRWSAGLLGDEKARDRYAEEWTATIEEIPGKLGPLLAALGILASVPKMRSIVRESRLDLSQDTDEPDSANADDSTALSPEWTTSPALFGSLPVRPTVRRLVLGGHLRRLREEAFITTERAAEAIRSSNYEVNRMEHGRVDFRKCDVADLLTLYGITGGEERDALLRLVHETNTPGWWQGYSDLLPHWVEPYLGLEAAASYIRDWELQFVPGLLQTEAYARAVIRLGKVLASEEEISRRAEARLARQDILNRGNPPWLWAIIDESALRRPVGGRAVMREQVKYLIEMAERPWVTLQILPFRIGSHPGMGGPFTILRFSEPDLGDIVYSEQLTSAIYLDKPADVDSYLEVMEQLCLQAEPAAETRRLLLEILDSL